MSCIIYDFFAIFLKWFVYCRGQFISYRGPLFTVLAHCRSLLFSSCFLIFNICNDHTLLRVPHDSQFRALAQIFPFFLPHMSHPLRLSPSLCHQPHQCNVVPLSLGHDLGRFWSILHYCWDIDVALLCPRIHARVRLIALGLLIRLSCVIDFQSRMTLLRISVLTRVAEICYT